MNDKTLTIFTDAWWPQVNGVVNTLMRTRAALTERGYQLTMLTPQDHATLPLDRERCRAEALQHTWAESSRQFSDNLYRPTDGDTAAATFSRRPFPLPARR
jgi:hypothetical protein